MHGLALRLPTPLLRLPATLAALAPLLIGACISLKPVVVDRKTRLETEVLGSFQRLEGELRLAATASRPVASATRRRVLQALLDRQYLSSAVSEHMRSGVLVELRSGLLDIDRGVARQKGIAVAEVERLAKRENVARETIMKGLIALSPTLSASDLPAIRALFYRLNGGASRKRGRPR